MHGREPGDSSSLSIEFRTAEYRAQQWRNLLASDQAPEDWEIWAANFRTVEEDRYTGVAGVDEPDWYDPVDRFLTRHSAPPLARAVVEFQRGLRSWDFARVSAAVDALVEAGEEADAWIPPTLVVEGGVVARLRRGDTRGALTLWEELRDRYDRPAGHLRRVLIASLMQQVDE